MAEDIEAIKQAVRDLGYTAPRDKQLEVIQSFVKGNDVFGVLPTGYGKSLCYSCLPRVFDLLRSSTEPEVRSIVVVTTPLIAIIKDQEKSLLEKGMAVASITGETGKDTKSRVCAGEYQLVFFTPELLINKSRWREMLMNDTYRKRLKGFVVDEAHCIKKWGDTFRETLKRIGEVRSLLPNGVPIMALTATATKTLQKMVEDLLSMQDVVTVSISPCKKNMMYAIGIFRSVKETFSLLLERLCRERNATPRTLIYCQSYTLCADIYLFFKASLGGDFTHPSGASDLNKYGLVNMFLGCTPISVKTEIIRQIKQPSSPLRIIIATSAFGMGVDCSNVRQVIHVGVTEDTELYIQETGRAGRDDNPALALLLKYSQHNRYGDKQILEYQSNTTMCRRDFLFRDIVDYKHIDLGFKCLCCDVCAKSCMCGVCRDNHLQFTFVGM